MNALLGTDKKYKAAMQAADLESTRLLASNPDKYKGAIGSLYEMNRLKGTKAFETILKRNNRMAANTALGYMAMMQGLETFEDAIEQGADRAEAAAIAWGAVAGMYAVDRTGLGELFFPELKGDALTYRKAISQVTGEINKGLLLVTCLSLTSWLRCLILLNNTLLIIGLTSGIILQDS